MTGNGQPGPAAGAFAELMAEVMAGATRFGGQRVQGGLGQRHDGTDRATAAA